jgi:hypothetical protein
MDIFILRDGEEIGPFGKETTQTLLSQGSVAENDLAWRPGMPDWVPLGEIFNSWGDGSDAPAEGANPAGASAPAADSANVQEEAATSKQKAFLKYLGIETPDTLTKQQAAVHLNDAMEDPALAPRVGKWNEERLRLHPDLFAAEISARRENRANHFFDVCQTEGAEYFPKITKAHCQVLVGFLDVKFPAWDARMENAAKDYFYPAIAEKFPQLIDRQWRGRFHYAEASNAAPEPSRRQARRPTRGMVKKTVSPVMAIVRGLVAGVVILVALYLGQRLILPWFAKHSVEEKEAVAAIPPAAEQKSVEGKEGGASATQTQNTKEAGNEDETLGKASKKKKAASVASASAPAAIPATAGENASPPGSVASVAVQPGNAAADPSMAGAPAAPVPTAPADPAMAAAPPPPDSGMAPGAAPAAGDAATAKTNLVLTKPVELQMTYGKIKLPVGTAVKLVSREAAMVKVNYQNTVMMLPASSTDIDSGAAPGGSSTGSPAPPAPMAN